MKPEECNHAWTLNDATRARLASVESELATLRERFQGTQRWCSRVEAALATVTAERDAARDALERARTRCGAYEDLLRMFTRPEFVHRDDIRATAIQLATALLAETTPPSQHGTGER